MRLSIRILGLELKLRRRLASLRTTGSQYVRELIRRDLAEQDYEAVQESRRALVDLRVEVRRVGINLNQISRRLNAGDSSHSQLAEELSALGRIRAGIDERLLKL